MTMKAEEYLRKNASYEQVGMGEYDYKVSLDDALEAVRMAREEVLCGFERELEEQISQQEREISMKALIRFFRNENDE